MWQGKGDTAARIMTAIDSSIAVIRATTIAATVAGALLVASATRANAAQMPSPDSCEYQVLYHYNDGANHDEDRSDVEQRIRDEVDVEPLSEEIVYMPDFAQCYIERKQYDTALSILQSVAAHYDHPSDTDPPFDTDDRAKLQYLFALTYEGLGNHALAVKYIDNAHDYGTDDDDIAAAFRRIDPAQFKRERQWALDDERAYWDRASGDERRVLAQHGGTRDDNGDSRPCHIESFRTAGVLARTWWYCDAKGQYSEAFHFRNGKLVSKYRP